MTQHWTHSLETEAAFRRDREAVDTMIDRGWAVAQQDRARQSIEAQHVAYDAKVALMVAQVQAVDLARQPSVRRMLLRLGGFGCRSGTSEFRQTVDALEQLGVTGANGVFEPDRAHIAKTYFAAKIEKMKEAAE